MRCILNGIFYVLRTGCAWRGCPLGRMPHEYPPWPTVYDDTLGLLLKVVVHVANIQDRAGVRLLLEPLTGVFPRRQKVWVDSGYTGTGEEWIATTMGWEVEVVKHPHPPRGRWVFPG